MQSSEIVPRLMALHAGTNTVLAAIDGPGGSGKSFLARSISKELIASGSKAWVVEMDDFFLPSELRPHGTALERPVGGDFDWIRLRDQVLAPLRRGETAQYGRYDWHRDELVGSHEVLPERIVIVEGIYSSRRELAEFYDLLVWVECPRAIRLARGLERDGEASRARWEQDWMPSEDRYVQEHQPQSHAHVIVDGVGV